LTTSNATKTWDIHQIRSLARSLIGTSKQFSQLVEYNPVPPTDQIVGDLASGWTVSADGQTYTFTLHEALWWDGEPVTADDIVFSFDRMVDPDKRRSGTAALNPFYEQGNARAIDEKTVEIKLKAPSAGFLARLGSDYMKMYAKHAVEGKTDKEMLCCFENNVGSGPWRVVEVKLGDLIRYERNPLYFKTGRPYWDETSVYYIKDRSRILTAYRTQQIVGNWAAHAATGPPVDVIKIEEDTNGRMRAKFAPAQAMMLLTLRTTVPPFDDPKARRAFHLAIDRDQMVVLLQRGFGLPGTFLRPGLVEDMATLDQVPGWRRPKEKDYEESRALLAELGWTDANPITGVLNCGSTAAGIRVCEAVTAQLRVSVPIDLTPRPIDTNVMYEAAREGTHAVSAWTTGVLIPDAADQIGSTIDVKTSRNPHSWTTPRMAELIKLQTEELDPIKRKGHLAEMVEILRKGESHFVPLVWAYSEGMLDHRIRNYHLGPTYHMRHKWDQVWWDPDHDPNDYEDYEILAKPPTPGS